MGLLPDPRADVDEAVAAVDALGARLGPGVPRADNPAKELAWRIGDGLPVIWGADGIGAVAAARWKAQFNENAKVPAWWSSLPELDHNEIVGWAPGRGKGWFVVALRHDGEPADVVARFGLSMRIAEESGAVIQEVWGAGRSALARLLTLVQMGDFVTTYHALAHEVDPTPMEAIDRLKTALDEAR
jgi:glucose/mannose-6-phosphate isomerase